MQTARQAVPWNQWRRKVPAGAKPLTGRRKSRFCPPRRRGRRHAHPGPSRPMASRPPAEGSGTATTFTKRLSGRKSPVWFRPPRGAS